MPQQQQDASELDAKRQANAIKLLSASNELKDSQITALQAEVKTVTYNVAGYWNCSRCVPATGSSVSRVVMTITVAYC